MSKHFNICLCLLIAVFSVTSCSRAGDEPDWLRLQQSGKAALIKGDYEKAEKDINASLQELEKHPEMQLEKAATLSYLAGLYDYKGDYAKAEEIYKQCIELSRSEPKHLGSEINNLGTIYFRQGKYAEAAKKHEEANELIKKYRGADSSSYANGLTNLGMCQLQLGDNEAGSKNLKTALAICEKLDLSDDMNKLELARSINCNTNYYVKIKDYDSALPFAERSLKFCKKNYKPESEAVSNATFMLAQVYVGLKKYKEAEKMFLESQKIGKSIIGTKNNPYVDGQIMLSKTYLKLGEKDKALEYATDAANLAKGLSNKLLQAAAQLQLSRAQLMNDKVEDAKSTLQQSWQILQDSESVSTKTKIEYLEKCLLVAKKADAQELVLQIQGKISELKKASD